MYRSAAINLVFWASSHLLNIVSVSPHCVGLAAINTQPWTVWHWAQSNISAAPSCKEVDRGTVLLDTICQQFSHTNMKPSEYRNKTGGSLVFQAAQLFHGTSCFMEPYWQTTVVHSWWDELSTIKTRNLPNMPHILLSRTTISSQPHPNTHSVKPLHSA